MSGITDVEALDRLDAMLEAVRGQISDAQDTYGLVSYLRDIIAARVAAGGTAGGVGHGD